MCNLHFRDGNSSNTPSLSIGEKFGSRPSLNSERMQRLMKRYASVVSPQPPVEKRPRTGNTPIELPPPLIAAADEVLGENGSGSDSDCHEIACLPSECSDSSSALLTSRPDTPASASTFYSLSLIPASSFAESSCRQSSADLEVGKPETAQIRYTKKVLSTRGYFL